MPEFPGVPKKDHFQRFANDTNSRYADKNLRSLQTVWLANGKLTDPEKKNILRHIFSCSKKTNQPI